jgi:hypothetical protein
MGRVREVQGLKDRNRRKRQWESKREIESEIQKLQRHE